MMKYSSGLLYAISPEHIRKLHIGEEAPLGDAPANSLRQFDGKRLMRRLFLLVRCAAKRAGRTDSIRD